jgi:peroxiredoxin
MALVPSTMLPLGTSAPDFTLRDTNGQTVSLLDFADAKTLVMMVICNHCPYVKHLKTALSTVAHDYRARGVAFVAINPNDPRVQPEDAIEHMRLDVQTFGYPFPYLVDASQEVARALQAACTPEFYVFGPTRRLVYRGQFDDSRPGNGVPVTGGDLRAALDAVLEGRPVAPDQTPSIGCSIKWTPGQAPTWVQ